MKKCSKNCQGCAGTDAEKIACPSWILIDVVSDIFKDLRRMQEIMSQAMIQELQTEIKNEIMDDPDDDPEGGIIPKAEKDFSHNKFFN